MAPSDNDDRLSWDIYSQPGLLELSVKIAKDDKEWVLLTLQTESDAEDGIALPSDLKCSQCGYRPSLF